jgi:hypothetical protein
MNIYIYLFASLIVIALATTFFVRGNNCSCSNYQKDNFCNCYSLGYKKCPEPKVLTAAYESGKLTETTDLGDKRPWPVDNIGVVPNPDAPRNWPKIPGMDYTGCF